MREYRMKPNYAVESTSQEAHTTMAVAERMEALVEPVEKLSAHVESVGHILSRKN